MMRRTSLIFVCFVAVQLAMPTKAAAWWEYIEALSGPKLHGPHFEWPVLCFMEDRRPEDQRTLERYVPRPAQGSEGLVLIVPGVRLPCLKDIGSGDRRKYSIDIGGRWHWDNSFGPANGNKVNFVSVGPVFSWNPIRRPTRDVIDLSGGGSVYWFFSDAFSTFSGGLVEGRADVHVPTVIRNLSRWTVLIPTGRFGVMLFPTGFEADVFADTENGFRSKPMEGPERGMYFGFFFDLEPLFR